MSYHARTRIYRNVASSQKKRAVSKHFRVLFTNKIPQDKHNNRQSED